ncbi:MAG: hypothetical protein ACI9R3_002438 [Verrucomicrobiales bacterium]|jgi:hypothetical protein
MNTILSLLISFCFIALTAGTREATVGSWSKKAEKISGTWKIEGKTLTLSGFAINKAPDHKIFLSPEPVSDLKK